MVNIRLHIGPPPRQGKAIDGRAGVNNNATDMAHDPSIFIMVSVVSFSPTMHINHIKCVSLLDAALRFLWTWERLGKLIVRLDIGRDNATDSSTQECVTLAFALTKICV
jgi:hypothetical protein